MRRRLLWILPATVAAVWVLGLISNAVTARGLETAVARRLMTPLEEFFKAHEELFKAHNEPFIIYAGDSLYPDSGAILRRAGYQVRACTPSPVNCFPWVGVTHSRSIGPFVAEVDCGVEEAGLSGSGMSVRFFTFFGLFWWSEDRSSWVS